MTLRDKYISNLKILFDKHQTADQLIRATYELYKRFFTSYDNYYDFFRNYWITIYPVLQDDILASEYAVQLFHETTHDIEQKIQLHHRLTQIDITCINLFIPYAISDLILYDPSYMCMSAAPVMQYLVSKEYLDRKASAYECILERLYVALINHPEALVNNLRCITNCISCIKVGILGSITTGEDLSCNTMI